MLRTLSVYRCIRIFNTKFKRRLSKKYGQRTWYFQLLVGSKSSLREFVCLAKGLFFPLVKRIWLVSIIVFLGICSRILSILSFVAIVKLFVFVIAPDRSLALLNKILLFVGINPTVLGDNVFYYLVFFVLVLALISLLLQYIKAFSLSSLRRYLILWHDKQLGGKYSIRKAGLASAKIPNGTESLLLLIEIFLFFVMISLFISLYAPVVVVSVICVSPFLLLYLIKRKVAERRYRNTASSVEKKRVFRDDSAYYLYLGDLVSANKRIMNNKNFSDFVFGNFFVLVIALYYSFGKEGAVDGYLVLLVVFGTRFLFGYVREASNSAAVLISLKAYLSNSIACNCCDWSEGMIEKND